MVLALAVLESDQLGRSVMVHLARRAGTYVLMMNVRRSVVDRECPSMFAAYGPYVARPLDANYWRAQRQADLGS
jgi:hypothetical protein